MGDLEGEGGATGSPLVSKCVLTEGGNDALVVEDIFIEEGGVDCFLLLLIYINDRSFH